MPVRGFAGSRRIGEDARDSRPGIFSAVPFDELRAGSAGLNSEPAVSRRGYKAAVFSIFTAILNSLRKKSARAGQQIPQGLKPVVFSIVYGPTKVVP
jgi:hypothetical protein